MSNKRNPGKNGSLQRNWEKAERRMWRAYHRSYYSKKQRIREKAWRTYCAGGWALWAFNHCFDGVTQ